MDAATTAPQSTGRLIWQFIKHLLKFFAASAATLIVVFFVSFAAASVASLVSGEYFLNANTATGIAFGAFLMSLYWVPAFPLLFAFAFPVWAFVELATRFFGLSARTTATSACVASWLVAFTVFVSVADEYAVKLWTLPYALVLALIAIVGGSIAYWIFRPKT